MFFFVKQRTAYELLISDWSSDVCSSDLHSPIFAQSNHALEFIAAQANFDRHAGHTVFGFGAKGVEHLAQASGIGIAIKRNAQAACSRFAGQLKIEYR